MDSVIYEEDPQTGIKKGFPVFCNFLENSIYHEVVDKERVRKSTLTYIDDYNS